MMRIQEYVAYLVSLNKILRLSFPREEILSSLTLFGNTFTRVAPLVLL